MTQSQAGQQTGKRIGSASKLIFHVLIISQIAGMMLLLSSMLEVKLLISLVNISYVGYTFALFIREFKPPSAAASKLLPETSPARMRGTVVMLVVGLICSALGSLVAILTPAIIAHVFPRDPGLAGLPVVLFCIVTTGLLIFIGLVLSIIVGYRAISSRYPEGLARTGRAAPFVNLGLGLAPLLTLIYLG